jgi:hypothetical protein
MKFSQHPERWKSFFVFLFSCWHVSNKRLYMFVELDVIGVEVEARFEKAPTPLLRELTPGVVEYVGLPEDAVENVGEIGCRRSPPQVPASLVRS